MAPLFIALHHHLPSLPPFHPRTLCFDLLLLDFCALYSVNPLPAAFLPTSIFVHPPLSFIFPSLSIVRFNRRCRSCSSYLLFSLSLSYTSLRLSVLSTYFGCATWFLPLLCIILYFSHLSSLCNLFPLVSNITTPKRVPLSSSMLLSFTYGNACMLGSDF